MKLSRSAAPNASRIAASALLGWMSREEALRFLQNDCVSAGPLTAAEAEDLWLTYKRQVEALPAGDARRTDILPMSEADIKAARKFRARHPNEHSIVDIVRLNPMDLIAHQHWISPTLADTYAASAAPAKWNQTTLLDPPVASPLKRSRDGEAFVFDLPHAEFLLTERPGPESLLQITEPRAFVTVAFYAGRAILLTGYHRTFALVRHLLAMPDAPRGVLFAVSNALDLMGSDADDVKVLMTSPRPPRVGDFFNSGLAAPVEMKRRRYQMRISYEVSYQDVTESDTTSAIEPAENQRQQITAIPPSQVTATFESAARLQREGHPEQAIQSYAAILRTQPNNKDVHLNLSTALLDAGRTGEAKAHAERAVWLNPGSADAQCNLGVVLRVQGSTDTAKRHCRQALAIDPGHDGALANLGHLHAVAGEFEDALSTFRKLLARRPDSADAWIGVSALKTFFPADPDVAALERLATGRGAMGRDAVLYHFALAKALEDCADFDRAFEHLRIGNKCQKDLIASAEQTNIDLFRAAAGSFSHETIQRLAGKGNPSRLPVFVIGMPRSGTTLIEQVLASHRQVHGAGELESLPNLMRSSLNLADPSAMAGLDTTKILQLADTYLNSLPLRPDVERIVDKMPSNFVFAGLIHLLFPNAAIIHSVRDPLDTCVSCYSTVFDRRQSFSYDLAELGRYYNRYQNLMRHWRSVLPVGRILDVRYEDLVSDFDAQVGRLVSFCGLEWDENCRAFHRNRRPVGTASLMQVRQPLYRSSVGRWRRFEKHLGPLLQELNSEGNAGMVAC